MADFAERDKFEKAMRRALGQVFGRTPPDLVRLLGDPPRADNVPASFWSALRQDLGGALQPLVERVYVSSARQLGSDAPIGVDWGLVNEAAAGWAKGYTFEMVKGVTDKSAAKLQRVVERYYEDGLTQGDLRGLLAPIFGPARARMIAVTEVTRASAQGELEIARQAADAGFPMVAVWQTNNDDLVCPVCGPLNGKKQGDGWDEPPPAHVNCRCWVNHEIPGLGAVEGGEAQRAAAEQAGPEAMRGGPGGDVPPDGSPGLRAVAATPGRFATLEEAQQWARATYPHITFEFDGAHIDTINPTLEQFEKLARDYPEVTARLKYIGTYAGPNVPEELVGTTFGEREAAHAHKNVTAIGLNPAIYSDAAEYKLALAEAAALKFHPPGCDTIEYMMSHEFGHLVDYYLAEQSNVSLTRVVPISGNSYIRNLLNNFKDENSVAIKKLSLYASGQHTEDERKSEAWAEAFAWQYHGTGKPHPYSERQAAFLELLKEKPWIKKGDWIWFRDATQEERDAMHAEMEEISKAIGVSY